MENTCTASRHDIAIYLYFETYKSYISVDLQMFIIVMYMVTT